VLTSFPPQPCVIAPQYKRDHSAAAALPYTNLIAHILTEKTCVANHNIICPKTTQEDTIDDSVSSTPGPSQYDPASLSTYHHRIHINSTLSSLSQESNPVASSNIFSSFPSSFHTPFSCQASHISFGPQQKIPHGHQTPHNHNILYAIDKDIFKVVNDKQNSYL
jgi:hypothetical protein